ncbi:hypothetical protein [Sphingomonas abietis]|uniref:Terminase small subunit n=1 Tax=Sphingomonas abietis TaxID=3012344 RepID=A0ABY7NRD2_9SPHN|nr:hypothetical protein [Sphingomonas abietis]WBO23943.1 hypothetical protein PBT88_07490 [Sphingomonas abietis]
MARRQRIDSAAGAVATMAAAARDLSPPKHLKIRRGDLPFWDAVIAERAKSEWTASDLAVAANLTRAMADAERIASAAVDGGGHIKLPDLIATIELSDKLARRIVTLRRALGLDNRSKNGEQRDVNKRREQAKEIEGGHNPMADDSDDLLARPRLN